MLIFLLFVNKIVDLLSFCVVELLISFILVTIAYEKRYLTKLPFIVDGMLKQLCYLRPVMKFINAGESLFSTRKVIKQIAAVSRADVIN